MKLNNKTALVTGGAKGIGWGIAQRFHEAGANVVIVDLDGEQGPVSARELDATSETTHFIQCDLRKSHEVQQAIAEAVERFGMFNVLVNNAGTNIPKTLEQTAEEEYDLLMDTNLRSTYLMTKYAIPHLRESGGGAIVNVASMAGVSGFNNSGVYSATKGGQVAMTRTLAIELAPDRIRVNTICPGYIRTPLAENWYAQRPDGEVLFQQVAEKHPLGRYGEPSDCGSAALYLVSDEATFITGVILPVDGGVTLGY